MKKMLVVLVLFCVILTGCTSKERARTFGGVDTINLPENTKLVNATWKETNLWYLTRPSKPGELGETYTFKEDSSYGLAEGTVVIVEHIK